jgi:hypothetical protein
MDQKTKKVSYELFQKLRSLVFSQDFKERHRQRLEDFTRKRCLTFPIIVIFLLNLVKRAMQDELDEFFKALQGTAIAERIVTKSAFTQARRKLKYEAFTELNRTQVDYFYEHFDIHTWQGFRLVAIDGSMSELPHVKAIADHFGVWHPAAGGTCPKARLSQMFDVLNHVTIDAILAPKAKGERALAELHFDHLKSNDLVLLDRGYPAFWLFRLILKQGAQFCARMPLTSWKIVEKFVASGLDEQIVTLKPGESASKACETHGLSTKPLTVRLIRIELKTGEIEVLATSLLDRDNYPVSVFKDLYHNRWPVEEDYKAIKSRIEVENWSGKTVLAIYQDFHAKVFTKNITVILAHPAQRIVKQESQGKKYVYQVNMANAFSKMKDSIVFLFQRSDILSLLESLWQLMIETIEPIRPGRSFSRKKRVKPKKFSMSYKPLR